MDVGLDIQADWTGQARTARFKKFQSDLIMGILIVIDTHKERCPGDAGTYLQN